MTPIAVTAHLRGPLTGAPMLDGLLAFVVARRAGHVAGFGPLVPIEIPIAREPGGRFHLCSSPIASWDQHERRFINRRFPVVEAQFLAEPSLRRIRISAGECRSYRLPGDVAWAGGDAIAWYAMGDPDGIQDLLAEVTHIGRRRAVGRGAVERWTVEPCEPWDNGFPVMRDGRPTRPLPLDHPGLVEFRPGYHTLSYPYYLHTEERLCALPLS